MPAPPLHPSRRHTLHTALGLAGAGLGLGACTSGPGVAPDSPSAPGALEAPPPATRWPPTAAVRVAVVGGLHLCGVWPALARMAAQALGLTIDTVAAAPKESMGAVFARGQADLLLIHANDEAMSLEAAGLAGPARVWGWNEHVIAGPQVDPANVRSAAGGVQAMQRIAAAAAPFIALRDPGSYGVVQRLWRRGGVRPDARWLLADTGPRPQAVLQLAAQRQAYVVVGRIPMHFGKMPAPPAIRLLLQGDAMMRKPYVLLTPGPRHPARAPAQAGRAEQAEQAEKLASYLLSPAGQTALAQANLAAGASTSSPWVFARDSVPAILDEELTA